MPLTANHEDRGRIDATVITDAGWAEVHRRGSPLACRDCCGRMVAAVSAKGLRHFRHYRRPEDCRSLGETAEHLEGKRRVIEAVRAVDGWTAEPEVAGDGWRADVLGVGPCGRRVAFEVQHSSLDDETAQERTRRHRTSGVETLWLDLRYRVVEALHPVVVRPGEWLASVCRWDKEYGRYHWIRATAPLAVIVDAYCRGQLVWHPPASGWTAPHYVRAEAAHYAEEAAQKAAEERQLAEMRIWQEKEFDRLRARQASLAEVVQKARLRRRVNAPELAWVMVRRHILALDAEPAKAIERALSMQLADGRDEVYRWVVGERLPYRWRNRGPIARALPHRV